MSYFNLNVGVVTYQKVIEIIFMFCFVYLCVRQLVPANNVCNAISIAWYLCFVSIKSLGVYQFAKEEWLISTV